MRRGVVFPQIETGDDAGAIDEYIEAVVESGYDHLIAYDHVLGADVTDRPDHPGPYTSDDAFQERFLPILVVGYLMAVVVRARRRGSTLLRTIFFLPYVIGGIFLLSLADRMRPRRLMIVGELVRVAVCLALGFAGFLAYAAFAQAPALAWLPFHFLAVPWLALNALICVFVARALVRKER